MTEQCSQRARSPRRTKRPETIRGGRHTQTGRHSWSRRLVSAGVRLETARINDAELPFGFCLFRAALLLCCRSLGELCCEWAILGAGNLRMNLGNYRSDNLAVSKFGLLTAHFQGVSLVEVGEDARESHPGFSEGVATPSQRFARPILLAGVFMCRPKWRLCKQAMLRCKLSVALLVRVVAHTVCLEKKRKACPRVAPLAAKRTLLHVYYWVWSRSRLRCRVVRRNKNASLVNLAPDVETPRT